MLSASPEILLLYAGQGPDPRVLPPLSQSLQNAYTEVTGMKIAEVADLPDETAYRGEVAQPLHIVRTAGAYEQLNKVLEENGLHSLRNRAGLIREPASLSEYLAFCHVGSWDIHTSLEAARQRGKYSDEFVQQHPGSYGMLATFYTAVTSGSDPGGRPLLDRLKEIIASNDTSLSEHQVAKNVFVGSYASESLITLTGLKTELAKIHDELRKHRREIGSIALNRINGAYHSPIMEPIRERMEDFINTAPTADPDPSAGILYSPTTGRQVRSAGDIKQIASDLLVYPVDQLMVFAGIWKSLRATNITVLPAVEIGNSRDYPWGVQQGVQTACIRDYSLYHTPINSRDEQIKLETVTFDGTEENASSEIFTQFLNKHIKLR